MAYKCGLIFDVDGVIADTEAANAKASIKVFDELFGVKGVVRADFEKGLGRGAAEYVLSAARVHGVELSDEQVLAATEARQDFFLRMLEEEPLPAFPGVLELINAALNRGDFCVGIATSGTREKSEAVLKSAKIPYDRMGYISGSDVKNKKPDPELFLTAVDRMGLESDMCVVIEDAPNGVEAAHAAGCKCIAVTNSTTPDKLADADKIVSSIEEVTIDELVNLIGIM